MDFQGNSFSLEQRIIATLVFFEIFHFCLNLDELQFFLLGEYEGNQKKLEEILSTMEGVEKTQGYYYLNGSSSLVEKRVLQNQVAQKFWKKVRFFVPFLQLIPFIKMVFICNNLAFGSVTEKSDIDLFIVTRKERIFTARLFSTVFFHLLGVRRHGKKVAGRFCLSFYMSEKSLDLRQFLQTPQDIYFAFWFLSLKPLNNQMILSDFLEQNSWINEYFCEIEQRLKRLSNKKYSFTLLLQKLFEFSLKGQFGDFIERKLSSYFMKRHQKKLTLLPENASVIVSKTTLKYHNDDQRSKIQKQFEARLRDFNFYKAFL